MLDISLDHLKREILRRRGNNLRIEHLICKHKRLPIVLVIWSAATCRRFCSNIPRHHKCQRTWQTNLTKAATSRRTPKTANYSTSLTPLPFPQRPHAFLKIGFLTIEVMSAVVP